MDNPFKSPAILSYCTGFRGLERGIERAIGATRTAVYVEIEAFIIENLLAGMEAGVLAPAPIWPNIKTFDARPFRGKIHGIVGGYPCQPFSNAGNRKGTEDPRHLYPYLERDIEAARPVWCFFENVGGHLSLGFGEVYRSLSGMGYAVEAGLYTAAEVGAPHERDRLFILAIRRDWLENAMCSGTGYKCIEACRRIGGQTLRQRNWPECPVCAGATGTDIALEHSNNRRCEQYDKGQRDIQKFGAGCEELANTSNPGLQGCGAFCREREATCRPASECGGTQWPARPGQPQYGWEEPRTVKPGMGSTINGYNFREDLLRAYGNSVVEQTAEIAMIDLLKKHGL